MRNCSTLHGAAFIGLAVLCAGCATTQPLPPFTPPPAAAPTAWAKSAKITALNINETDESQLLGLNMWRFNIMAPKPNHQINFVVEAQEIGKPPRTLVSLPMEPGWPMNKRLSVFVGQSPLYDGKNMSAKANYQIRLDGFRDAPLRQMGGSSTSAITDNPLNGLADTGSSGTPEQRPDGSFALSYGCRHSFPSQPQQTPDVAVVFRVEEQAY